MRFRRQLDRMDVDFEDKNSYSEALDIGKEVHPMTCEVSALSPLAAK